MSPLATIPDAELIVGAWLREHEDIIALDARVAPRTPNTTTKPWIRVTQLAAPRIARAPVDIAADFMLQLDCYAGSEAMASHAGQPEAKALALAVRAVVCAMQDQVIDDVFVSRAHVIGDMRAPDMDFEPARERYVLTAQVMMRAIRT